MAIKWTVVKLLRKTMQIRQLFQVSLYEIAWFQLFFMCIWWWMCIVFVSVGTRRRGRMESCCELGQIPRRCGTKDGSLDGRRTGQGMPAFVRSHQPRPTVVDRYKHFPTLLLLVTCDLLERYCEITLTTSICLSFQICFFS